MALFAELGHGIYCIDALYVKPGVASIYLSVADDEVAIVETGTSRSLANVLDTLSALGIEKSRVRYVIPTHVHLDHAGGAGVMMQAFERASLLIHPRGARHMADPRKLIDGTVAVYGQARFDELYERIEPVDEARIVVAEDLSRHSLGSRELLFIDTPGHAYHHFCIYDAHSSGIFTGDTFGLGYDAMKGLPRGLIPTTPPSQFDPQALRASIARLADYRPERLYLTHYGAFENPLAQITSFNRWIDRYVELCEAVRPDSDSGLARLEAELGRAVMDGLAAGDAEDEIVRVLKTDIHLNAQGLAYWWQRARHA